METSKQEKFSVLMSVYRKDNPKYFQQAVESVINQTIKPSEIIIVKDGKLPEELEVICDFLKEKNGISIRYIQLEKNMGLGVALQKGLIECNYDLVARMDSDDIAKGNRFELQLNRFTEDPDLVICGGYIEEFSETPDEVYALRRVPLECDDIREFSKKRNPFNHMTVMFKKKAILSVGNYMPFYLLEDYYLWVRVINADYKTANIPNVLVSVRAGKNMIDRRGGIKYFLNEVRLYTELHNKRYINGTELISVLIGRGIIRILPNKLRGLFYKYKLRN